MNVDKIVELLKIVPQRPVEAWDRVQTFLEVRSDQKGSAPGNYQPIVWDQLVEQLNMVFDGNASDFAREPELARIETMVSGKQASLGQRAPWTVTTDGDMLLGRICYIVVRATQPEIVLETGVAYGVTTSSVLQALQVNGHGTLHSVDIPPLGKEADRYVGALIPDDLRANWQLHRGPSKRVLPGLLPKIGNVDLFIHDSLHTYKTMLWEFETVEPFLASGASVIADDVQGNRAFGYWSANRKARFWTTLQEEEKEALLGISIG